MVVLTLIERSTWTVTQPSGENGPQSQRAEVLVEDRVGHIFHGNSLISMILCVNNQVSGASLADGTPLSK
jgi:hypothetical protein